MDRMAQTFLKSDGDIREVLHTMIYSPEFWSKDAYRAKIKTPFELVASATRAVGAEVDIPLAAGAMDQPHRPAALPVRASDRLLRQGRRLGEYRRAAQPHEFFAGADVESSPRRAGGYRFAVRQRHGGRIRTRRSTARFRCCWAARRRRKRATRWKSRWTIRRFCRPASTTGQAGERGDDRGIGVGFAGVSAAISGTGFSLWLLFCPGSAIQ